MTPPGHVDAAERTKRKRDTEQKTYIGHGRRSDHRPCVSSFDDGWRGSPRVGLELVARGCSQENCPRTVWTRSRGVSFWLAGGMLRSRQWGHFFVLVEGAKRGSSKQEQAWIAQAMASPSGSCVGSIEEHSSCILKDLLSAIGSVYDTPISSTA